MLALRSGIVILTAALAWAGDRGAAQEQIKPMPTPAPRDGAAAPRPGTAVLSGTLVAADSGRPVRRATVTLSSPESGVRKSATTDEAGVFSFAQLPPGSFSLTATRQGYLDVTFGQRTPGSGRPGTAIQLAAGQRLEGVSLRMPRTGIVTGVIIDEFGDPVMGMQVRAWRYVKRSGERTLQSAGTATTDDRGIYRIAGLVPGEYLVGTGARDTSETMMIEVMKMREAAVERTMSAAVVDGRATWSYAVPAISGSHQTTSGYAAVYYPGTLQSSSATAVTLGISEERSGVDVQLQVVPLARITGSVIGPDGGLPAGVTVRLVDAGSTLPTARVFSGPVRPDGSFTISAVPPGQYTLHAHTNARIQMRVADHSGAMTFESKSMVLHDVELDRSGNVQKYLESQDAPGALWGRMDLAVDGSPLTNVVLPLQRGFDVSGTFAFDGAPPPPPDRDIRLQLIPVEATGPDAGVGAIGAVNAAGRFTMRGVPPGRYRLTTSWIPNGWTMKSAEFGGRDVLDTTLEVKAGDELSSGIVTFTSQSTELAGTLQDNSGKPIADYTIVVFAADRRYWTPMSRRIQATRPATDGRFSFRNLPAGDYRLIAVVDPEPGEWFDPAFLDRLVGATMPITLGEGERKTQDVRVAR